MEQQGKTNGFRSLTFHFFISINIHFGFELDFLLLQFIISVEGRRAMQKLS